MVLEKEAGTLDNNLAIVSYATKHTVKEAFDLLLTYTTKTYSPDRYVATLDNTTCEDRLYEEAGFLAEKVSSPDYLYVVGKYRKDRNSLADEELQSLTDLDRIWDAGKTRYELFL